ncbi:hypothetical protein ACKWTF_015960 [Chironomus riparius]
MRSIKLSTLGLQMFLIAAIFAVLTQTSLQNSINCDFNKRTEEKILCIINKTAISHPDTKIDHDNVDKLNVLKIFGTSIEYLPVKLDLSFPKLHQYFVDNARFSKIEKKNLENLKSLKILILKSKSCSEVAKDAFEDLENLTFLNLADSSISYFHSETFKPLKNLEVLNILGNNLEILHPHAFDSLNQLQILSFARNNLITLNRQLFLNKNELRIIDGYDNNFEHLDETTFDGLQLESLNLQQSGSCSLYKYQLTERQEIMNMDEVKEDIRDDCKGTDFKIYEIHARTMEIVGKFGDKM